MEKDFTGSEAELDSLDSLSVDFSIGEGISRDSGFGGDSGNWNDVAPELAYVDFSAIHKSFTLF